MASKKSSTESSYFRQYYEEHKNQIKAKSKTTYWRNKANGKRHWLKSVYGITQEQYEALLEAHGWRCALCLKAYSGKNRALAIDHNHITGKVRGILCLGCNSKLTAIEDSKFKALAESYLQYYKELESNVAVNR